MPEYEVRCLEYGEDECFRNTWDEVREDLCWSVKIQLLEDVPDVSEISVARIPD